MKPSIQPPQPIADVWQWTQKTPQMVLLSALSPFALGFFICPLLLFCFGGVSPGYAATKSKKNIHRVALLIGHNNGGPKVKSLKYALADAVKVKRTLLQLGGYRPQDVRMLLNPSATEVRKTMNSLKKRIRAIQKQHNNQVQVVLFVYYSGHARQGRLLLGKSSLSFHRIKRFMKESKASLRLAIFDACESGKLTRIRGLKRLKKGFRFPAVHMTPSASGEVVITATGANENAHEDPRLQGGVFTHYLLLALRGAADRNNDGHVTLEEAYTYSYSRALERSIFSYHGPQRARFSKQLKGYGSLVLTTLSKQRTWLVFGNKVKGEFFIWNRKRDLLVAELNKRKKRSLRLALVPGRYVVQWRQTQGVFSRNIHLKKGRSYHLKSDRPLLAYWQKSQLRGGDVKHTAPPPKRRNHIALSYRLGYGALREGMLRQGAELHLALPLPGPYNLSFLVQNTYQYGFADLGAISYHLHSLDLDLGVLALLVHKGGFRFGLGGLLRLTGLVQDVTDSTDPNSTVLSFSSGLMGLAQARYHFSSRAYLQAQILGGPSFLKLGLNWSLRWNVHTSVGVGIQL